MNVILGIKQKPIHEAIAIKLIPEGITALPVKSIEELLGVLPEISKIAILEEELFGEKDLYSGLASIKNSPDGKYSRVALLSKKTYNISSAELAGKGIDLLLQSSLSVESIASRVIKFIYQFCNHDEKRTYVRINARPLDQVNLRLLDPQDNHYHQAKVTDISMGGLAIELPKVMNNVKLPPQLNRAQVKIQAKTIIVDLQLIKTGSGAAAFRFLNLNDSARDMLAAFIYTKIQDQLSGKTG